MVSWFHCKSVKMPLNCLIPLHLYIYIYHFYKITCFILGCRQNNGEFTNQDLVPVSSKNLQVMLDWHRESELLTFSSLSATDPDSHIDTPLNRLITGNNEREGGEKNPKRLKFYCLCCHVHSQGLVTLGFVDRGSWLILPPFTFDYCQDFYVFPVDFGSLWGRLRESLREM